MNRDGKLGGLSVFFVGVMPSLFIAIALPGCAPPRSWAQETPSSRSRPPAASWKPFSAKAGEAGDKHSDRTGLECIKVEDTLADGDGNVETERITMCRPQPVDKPEATEGRFRPGRRD